MNEFNNYTTVQISAKIYWGFNIEIPNFKIVTMSDKDIIDEIENFMKTFFSRKTNTCVFAHIQ